MSTNPAPQHSEKAQDRTVLAFYPSDPTTHEPTVKAVKLKDLDVSQATKHPLPKWAERVSIYRTGIDGRMIATIRLAALGPLTNWKRHVGQIDTLYVMSLEPVEVVKGWSVLFGHILAR